MNCDRCQGKDIVKGRAMDGRRAYRCEFCGNIWTQGMQGKKKTYTEQRKGFQFHDTGATRLVGR